MGTSGGCTATLIAPDLALTAAHCVPARDSEKYAAMEFHPTDADGLPGPGVPVRATGVHPLYRVLKGRGTEVAGMPQNDMALLRLAEPVAAEVAKPIPVATAAVVEGVPVIISFRGAAGGPQRQRPCPLIRDEAERFAVGCAVRSGESGAPLLATTEAGLAVIGVVTLSLRSPRGEQALGPRIGGNFAVLMSLAPP